MTYGVVFALTDIWVERLHVHVLDHGTVCGLIVESKGLATTSIPCITWIQYICQRVTINVTPDLYVCFANLIPLTFPHDGVHVTTGLYTFYPSFRFTIQVTHGLVEHGVESLLVVTRGANRGTYIQGRHRPIYDVLTHNMRLPTTWHPSGTSRPQTTRACIGHR